MRHCRFEPTDWPSVRFDGSRKSVNVCRRRPSNKSLKNAVTELSKLYYLSHKFVGESGSALAFLICFFFSRSAIHHNANLNAIFFVTSFFYRERVPPAVEPCLPHWYAYTHTRANVVFRVSTAIHTIEIRIFCKMNEEFCAHTATLEMNCVRQHKTYYFSIFLSLSVLLTSDTVNLVVWYWIDKNVFIRNENQCTCFDWSEKRTTTTITSTDFH